VRPGLQWALGATLVSSAAAWLWPAAQPMFSARAAPTNEVANLPGSPASTVKPGALALPARLTPLILVDDTAQVAPFDPFVGVVTAPPSPPPAASAAPPPAPPPAPPQPSYRFFGRVEGVSGAPEIYLAKGDSVVLAEPGTRLDDGYVVDTVTAAEVRLAYPSLDARAVIPLPADTGPDIR